MNDVSQARADSQAQHLPYLSEVAALAQQSAAALVLFFIGRVDTPIRSRHSPVDHDQWAWAGIYLFVRVRAANRLEIDRFNESSRIRLCCHRPMR